MLRWVGWLSLMGVGVFTRPAAAQDEVAFEYRAPSGCPGRATFVARLADRGGRLQSPEAAEKAASVTVVIEPNASGFSGSLRIVTRQGTSSERVVHDPECSEVVTGLAVIAAMALGANDSSSPPPRPEAPTAEAPPPALGPTAALARPAAPPPTSDAPGRLQGTSFGLPPAIPVDSGKLRFTTDRRYGFSLGADYGLVAKRWLPRYDFATTVTSFVTTPNGATRITGPILQARWSLWGPGSAERADVSLQVLGLGASVASCSALSYDTRAWVLLACGEFGVGWLATKSRSQDGKFEKEGGGGFGTAGFSFSAERNLGDLFHVGLRLGGRLQMGGRQGDRPDGTALLDMPIVAGFGAFNVGLHF